MNELKLLPLLLIFAEVAKQQSFTRAAEKYGLSKAGVSQQIKRLEEHIGQQLLSRHTRGMALTAAGENLLKRSELLQQQVNLAITELDNNKEMPSGRFAITAPHSCQNSVLIPALQQLCLEFPLLEPEVHISDKVVDLIQDKFDVSIYAGNLKDSAYRAAPLANAREILCASPSYLSAQQLATKLTPAQLEPLRFVSAPWQQGNLALYASDVDEIKMQAAAELQLKRMSLIKANTLSVCLDMVLADMGFALLPEFVCREALGQGRLVRLLPELQGRTWPFYFLHRFQADKPVHIQRLQQLLGFYFQRLNA